MRIDRRAWSVAFWGALIFAFVMAVLPHPPQLPLDPNDKAQHMLAFSVLSILASLAWPSARGWVIAATLSGVGALIELVQAIPMLHRDADVTDWIADTIAIIVALGIVAVLRTVRAGKLAA